VGIVRRAWSPTAIVPAVLTNVLRLTSCLTLHRLVAAKSIYESSLDFSFRRCQWVIKPIGGVFSTAQTSAQSLVMH
jgi:hypothetical protein